MKTTGKRHEGRGKSGHRFGIALLTLAAGACATLQQVAALRQVQFSIDRVSAVRLAGVDLAAKQSYRDLTLAEGAAFGAAVARRELPLEFLLHVRGENPPDNRVSARLIRMEWTLLLEDRVTISGVLDREVLFPPGEPQDMPLTIRLNLVEFFSQNAPELFALARNLTGQGGSPLQVRLRALPTIQTALGPMRFPEPITIVSRTVGQ